MEVLQQNPLLVLAALAIVITALWVGWDIFKPTHVRPLKGVGHKVHARYIEDVPSGAKTFGASSKQYVLVMDDGVGNNYTVVVTEAQYKAAVPGQTWFDGYSVIDTQPKPQKPAGQKDRSEKYEE